MIRSFKHRGLRRFFVRGDASGIHASHRGTIEQILTALNVAMAPSWLSLPRYHLHPLTGDRAGFWAVTVRANWRIVFRFENGEVHDVDLVDYH